MAISNTGGTALRWDAFAAGIADGLNPREAALAAGYGQRAATEMARQLMQNPEVQAMIDMKRAATAVRTDWTVDRIVHELAETATRARDDSDYKAAIAAYELIGRHIGMWPRGATVDASQHLTLALPDGATLDDLRALAALPVQEDGPLMIEARDVT